MRTVLSPIGPVRVHAVCVPWSMAHVSGGHENRKPWEDHINFLNALEGVLGQEAKDPANHELPLILAGDINQREQPRPYGNVKARKLWAKILDDAGLEAVTDEAMIDKIVIDPAFLPRTRRCFRRRRCPTTTPSAAWSGKRRTDLPVATRPASPLPVATVLFAVAAIAHVAPDTAPVLRRVIEGPVAAVIRADQAFPFIASLRLADDADQLCDQSCSR